MKNGKAHDEKADLILSRTEETVSFAACILLLIVERILSSFPPVRLFITEYAVLKVPCTPVIVAATIPFMPPPLD